MTAQARRPLLALAAALVMPGLGHLYVGEIVRGLACLVSGALVVPVAAEVAFWVPGSALCFVIFFGVAATLGLYIGSAIDAVRIAKQRPPGALRPYQRALVYGLYVAGGYLLVLRPAATFTRTERLEAFKIPSASMSPTLLPGDRLFADKTVGHPGGTRLWRGALALFIYPNERTSTFIKRVIGLPGDQVEITGHRVVVNGRELTSSGDGGANCQPRDVLGGHCVRERADRGDYSVLWSSDSAPSKGEGTRRWTVPDGQVFVLGDNRDSAIDSRRFGTVALSDVVGVARQVWFSSASGVGIRWDRIGTVLR